MSIRHRMASVASAMSTVKRSSTRATVVVVALIATVTTPAVSAFLERPVTGSPGSLEGIDLVAQRCPTFSWGTVNGASGYEIVVYALPAGETAMAEAAPVLARSLAGGLVVWTPSADGCLETGGEYAWFVRARDEEGVGEWSQARLFEIAPSSPPSVFEVERALEVLAPYLRGGGSLALSRPEGTGERQAAPDRRPSLSQRRALAEGEPGSRAVAVAAVATMERMAAMPAMGAKRANESSAGSGETNMTSKAVAAPDVVALRGEVPDLSGVTVGLYGASASGDDESAGVVGESMAMSGATLGVLGSVRSPDGVAGVFDNAAGGQILSGRNDGDEVFSVEGDGLVRGGLFVGNGSALTEVDAATLGGQPGSFYRDWNQLTGVPAGFADGIDNDSGGDITAVFAGTGLEGGGTSGDVTVAVDFGKTQARVVGSCLPGEAIVAIHADGSVACGFVEASTAVSIVDDPVGSVGEFTSIALGADGFPVISYYDATDGALKVAKCNDVFCAGGDETLTTVDDSANVVGKWTSLAIGTDGFPVVSYYDETAFTLKVAKCNDPGCEGGDETVSVVDDPAELVGQYTSLVLGADGLPVISYYDATADALKVVKCNDAACDPTVSGPETISVVDDPVGNNVGQYTCITLGADGFPVISYYDATDGNLKVAKCNDAACAGADESLFTVDDAANAVGQWTSMTLGSDGLPVISYYDATADDLKVAKCNDAACDPVLGGPATITAVDSVQFSDDGWYTSIALGADGLPVISYRNFGAGALKVAKCNDSACSGSNEVITTVDDPQHLVGRDTSIALGADGLPVISYFDQTAGALKVAKCVNASCR